MLGKVSIALEAQIAKFESDMGRAARIAEKDAKRIQQSIDRSFGKMRNTVVGFAAAFVSVQAVMQGFTNQINQLDRLDELSARLQISTEKLSTWGYAAKLSGTDLESLTGALTKFSKNVAAAADADSQQGELFAALGVKALDAEGKLRSVEELLPQIADKFAELDNATLETALSMELFGKSGAELLEFLNKGSSGIAELEEKARSLGIEIDSNTAQAAAKFKDEVDNLKAAMQGLITQTLEPILPLLTSMVSEMTDSATEANSAGSAARSMGEGFEFAVRFIVAAHSALSGMRAAMADFELAGRQFSPADGIRSLLDGGDYMAPYAELKKRQAELQAEAKRQEDRFLNAINGGPIGKAPAAKPVVDPMFPILPWEQKPSYSAVPLPGLGVPLSQNGKKTEAALGRFFGGDTPTPKGSKAAGADRSAIEALKARQEAERELAELIRARDQAEKEFSLTLEDLTAEMAGPLAQAELEHKRQQEELIALAKKGEVSDKDLASAKELLAEQHREVTEEIERQMNPGRELLADLQFEMDLLHMTNAERATAIQLRGMEADQVVKYGDAIRKANEDLERQADRIGDQVEAMDAVRDSAKGFLSDIRDGVNAWDAMKDAIDRVADRLFDLAAENIMDSLFGKQGTTGAGSSGGGWLSSILGAFFGSGGGAQSSPGNVQPSGSGYAGIIGGLANAYGGSAPASSGSGGFWTSLIGMFFGGGRATGGPVSGGMLYETGEMGQPEIFRSRGKQYLIPGNDGTVEPMRGGRGFSQTNQFYFAAPTSLSTQKQVSARVGFESRRELVRN